MLVCDKCKAEFSLEPVDIKAARIKIKDQDYIVRYFVCPNCNHVYLFVFLRFDDMATMLAGQNMYTQYQMAVKNKQIALAKRLYQRHHSINQLLEDRMKKLMSEYSNGFVYDKANDKIYYREK